MLKRFLITVCCLLVTMLSIMAQEEYGNDWSLWISSEKRLCNEQPAPAANELTDQNSKLIHTNEYAFGKPFIRVSERLIAPISFTVELNHQANSYYQKCGFNFEKECCCGCNAPPHSDFITIYPKGSYTMSKTAVKDASSRLAIPLFAPCKWPKRNFKTDIKERNFHNYRNLSFIKSCTEKLFVCDAT